MLVATIASARLKVPAAEAPSPCRGWSGYTGRDMRISGRGDAAGSGSRGRGAAADVRADARRPRTLELADGRPGRDQPGAGPRHGALRCRRVGGAVVDAVEVEVGGQHDGVGRAAGGEVREAYCATARWVSMTVTAMMSKMPPSSVYLGSASSSSRFRRL